MTNEKTHTVQDASYQESHDYKYKKDFRTALPQILAVSVKNCLLLVYGMTLGFPTILIPALQNPVDGEKIHLGTTQVSWIASINLIIVPVGCALSGAVTTPLGRRRAMQLVEIPFFVAWLLFYYSPSSEYLYAALFLTGLAGGLLEAPVLTYVAEITQPHLRGWLTATSSMCIIIGVFTQFLLGLFLYWRNIAVLNILFTIVSVVLLFFIPESPHWLISRKRIDEARLSLQWLRGWTDPNSVENELKDIQALFAGGKGLDDNKESILSQLSHYTKRTFLQPFFLVSFSFFVGHFSGMTTLQTYAVSIFQMLDAPLDKYYATLIIGIVQIIGSGMCVSLVHFLGKRPLTFFSTGGAAVCCFLVAIYDYTNKKSLLSLDQNNQSFQMANGTSSSINNENNIYSWVPMVLLMVLAFITHCGIRLLPWILIGEVYNSKTKSGAAGLSGAVGYIFGFLTNKTFINMVHTISIWGTYGSYGIVCTIGCIVLYFILPETEGKKLNDIENHYSGVRKLTNSVYKSQKRKSKTLSSQKGVVNLSYQEEFTKF